jgi:uncharacterized protein YcbK (DUF882 family)
MIKAYTTEQNNEKVGPHFKVKEFACKDGSTITFIDDYMVTILELLRKKLKKPIIITSGYRTPQHNAKVGGAKYSYHMRGMAVDIRVNGISAKEVAKALDKIVEGGGIIVYNSWVHFDVRNGKKYRKGV